MVQKLAGGPGIFFRGMATPDTEQLGLENSRSPLSSHPRGPASARYAAAPHSGFPTLFHRADVRGHRDRRTGRPRGLS